MRLIRTIIVLGLCVAGLGFYRGWFSISSQGGDAGSNKVNVNLTVDPDKVKADAEKVKDKTKEIGNQAKDKVTTNGN